MKKIIFCGGGTGGHIYPAISIREAILERFNGKLETAFIGREDSMEAKIIGRISDLPFLSIRAQGLPRTFSVSKWLSFPFRNLAGFADAQRHLRRFVPDLIITTGGFVTFPVLLAAYFLKIPYIIHEQNAAIGVTNRIFSGTSKKFLLSFPQSSDKIPKQGVVTGNPVRNEFRSLKNSNSSNKQISTNHSGESFTSDSSADFPSHCELFKREIGDFWILLVGGSSGAASLNKVAIALSKGWLTRNPEVKLIHITGERDYEKIKIDVSQNPRHIVLPYLHEMRWAFEVSDLLISRAGATILAEMAVCGKPAILIPYPHATDNHQEKNARALERIGAVRIILDCDLTEELLESYITEMRKEKTLLNMAEAMASSRPQDVEERIYNEIAPFLV